MIYSHVPHDKKLATRAGPAQSAKCIPIAEEQENAHPGGQNVRTQDTDWPSSVSSSTHPHRRLLQTQNQGLRVILFEGIAIPYE